MTFIDDRTEEQKKTHRYLVTATDKAMSGWGGARGGKNKCAWATDSYEKAQRLYQWVSNRSEMIHVNLTDRPWRPRNAAHVHIYVANETHPALSQ